MWSYFSLSLSAWFLFLSFPNHLSWTPNPSNESYPCPLIRRSRRSWHGISRVERFEHLSHNLGFRNGFPKIQSWVHYVFELGIELIERLILLHLDFFKACSEPLKLWILDSLGSFIGCLEDGPYFLRNFSGGYLLEFLISDCIEQSINALLLKFAALILASS